jgi:TPR repeat protein
MKKIVSGIVFTGALISALSVAGAMASSLKKEINDHFLKITSYPDDAKVFINKEFVGVTPYFGQKNKGSYDVKLVKRDFLEETLSVVINTSEVTDQYVQLVRVPKVNFPTLLRQAENGDKYAQKDLGNLYLEGEQVAVNFTKAMHWYKKSADQGYANAMHNIGLLYSKGYGVEVDIGKAIFWYTKSARLGLNNSQNTLADFALDGVVGGRDFPAAIKWFTVSAEQGDSYALRNLAGIYWYNPDFLNQKKSLELYRKAAYLGDGVSLVRLGVVYSEGVLVEKDLKKAAYYYDLAAQLGDADGQMKLAMAYLGGEGVEVDNEKARELFEQLYLIDAKLIKGTAAAFLGHIYWGGRGVRVNYKTALSWYQKAEAAGDIEVIFNIAYMYFNGQGVNADKEKGLTYMIEARDKGNERAKNWLIERGYK